jgi:truncated hemoglobin YjbI
MTLFDKYDGVTTVTLIVRAFYKEVLGNPKLKPYFAGVDDESLIHHQIGFISHLLGILALPQFSRHSIVPKLDWRKLG